MGRMPRKSHAAALAVACALVAGGILALPASASVGKGHRLILSPRSGEGHPAGPVKIRVHAGPSKRFRAQLNGQPIAIHFSRPSDGVRKLEASLSYGLRHGANRFHVRVGHRTESSRFRVWKGRPLVGAGIDRTVTAGAKVYLDGRSRGARPQKALGARAAAGRSLEWSTVTTPPGSPPAAPGDPNKRHIVFQPSVPGTYQLKLTVKGANGKMGSDVVDIEADPAPAVHIDTMAFQPGSDQSSIQVGDKYYESQPDSWAQLVVLDRKTLTPVSGDLGNQAYFCPGHEDEGCDATQADLKSDLAGLNSNQLAIVTNPYNRSQDSDFYQLAYGLEAALARIGVAETVSEVDWNYGTLGAVSAIGVPGTKPGQGDWHAAVSSDQGAGDLQGWLVRDNLKNYTFAPTDRFDFSTQAAGSNASTNVIQVNGKNFTQTFNGGISTGGGFQVVVLDAQTLEGDTYWYETDHSDPTALLGQLEAMRSRIHDANHPPYMGKPVHPQLVFIASLGKPMLRISSDAINQATSKLVDEVEALGGTRNGFYKMLDPGLYGNHGYSYTLISTSNSGGGEGEESVGTGITGTGTGPLNTVPTTGTLVRGGPNWTFMVQGAQDAFQGTGRDSSRGAKELTKVAFESPKPWPEAGNAKRTNAIQWIGKQIFGTTDPRGQYFTAGYVNGQYDYDYWDGASKGVLVRLAALNYQNNPGFSSDDFNWAQGELETEINWLLSTHRYLDKLATPFDANSQFKSWASVTTISNDIRDKVMQGTDGQTTATSGALFNALRNLVPLIPGIGEAAEAAALAANIVYETVMDIVEINSQEADDDYQSSANQVAEKLQDRFEAARGFLTKQLPNTISADWGKLSKVGACASTIPADWADCPFDPKDWQYTGGDQDDAAAALIPSTKAWAYGALLPARYSLYKLPPWWRTKTANEFYGLTIEAIYFPWDGQPDTAQLAKPIIRNAPSYSHTITNDYRSVGETWQIYALGFLTGNGTVNNRWEMHHPDASVTDKLFNSPTDTTTPGLGVDPEAFFDQHFTGDYAPKTLDHYPERDTPTGWCAVPIRVADPPCD